MIFTPQNITFGLSIVALLFTIYNYFRNPQIKTDQETQSLRGEINTIRTEVKEIKETHLRSLEAEIKSLNTSVNELSKTVVKLATIIDERIPRN